MQYREILRKGDLVIFNKDLLKPLIQTHYNDLLKKEISTIPFCRWVPEELEPFIVKKAKEQRFGAKGEHTYELWVSLYSEKGPWTSRMFPAKYLQWIIHKENGVTERDIFISRVFNNDLFVAKGEDAEWKWLNYQSYMKDKKR